jgi:hypothetical protein
MWLNLVEERSSVWLHHKIDKRQKTNKQKKNPASNQFGYITKLTKKNETLAPTVLTIQYNTKSHTIPIAGFLHNTKGTKTPYAHHRPRSSYKVYFEPSYFSSHFQMERCPTDPPELSNVPFSFPPMKQIIKKESHILCPKSSPLETT